MSTTGEQAVLTLEQRGHVLLGPESPALAHFGRRAPAVGFPDGR